MLAGWMAHRVLFSFLSVEMMSAYVSWSYITKIVGIERMVIDYILKPFIRQPIAMTHPNPLVVGAVNCIPFKNCSILRPRHLLDETDDDTTLA